MVLAGVRAPGPGVDIGEPRGTPGLAAPSCGVCTRAEAGGPADRDAAGVVCGVAGVGVREPRGGVGAGVAGTGRTGDGVRSVAKAEVAVGAVVDAPALAAAAAAAASSPACITPFFSSRSPPASSVDSGSTWGVSRVACWWFGQLVGLLVGW